MKKRLLLLILTLTVFAGLLLVCTLPACAAEGDLPTAMWVAPSETNGLPAQIDVIISNTSSNYDRRTGITTYNYTCGLYLPGNADVSNIFLSWADGMTCDTTGYASGSCPVPSPDEQTTYTFTKGKTVAEFVVSAYKGSADVQRVFIDIDESQGTIAAMNADHDHETVCVGRININGTWYEMPKIKGRGNWTWWASQDYDKHGYNITLKGKINFPGIDSDKTKKWSFLSEIGDHSLLCNRTGFKLANEMGIGQDTTSADVWMNGVYQGCYTVTPKTDSFVPDDGFMIENDNYEETLSVAEGGDPQFKLEGLNGTSATAWDNCITVKEIGDNLLGTNEQGKVDESPENLIRVANEVIQPWLQDAWDAIRSEGVASGYQKGYNSKGKYYTEYIDIESFAKMYLMHEYVKSYDVCAGSIIFHRDGMTEDDKLIAGPIWDMDNALGSTQQNRNLGKADDRSNGDRRSGAGSFISNVTEYKTSIFKALYQHEDFQEEVKRQYNLNRDYFDALPGDVQDLIDEIDDSAKMNHRKVQDVTGYNLHKYSRNNQTSDGTTTLESGTVYEQSMLATSNSKTDWANYAANLKTYVTARTLWFHNTYYDASICNHNYVATVTKEPTCTEEGVRTYTCSKCGDTYTEAIPMLPHDFDDDGICVICDFAAPKATIVYGEGASVTVYKTQDLTGACVENASFANPRNSKTGEIDISGEGQINFVVNLEPGYKLVKVTAEPTSSYKNLKTNVSDTIPNSYRLTKVSGDLTINVITEVRLDVDFAHSCSFANNITVNYYVPAADLEGFENFRLVLQKQVHNEDGSSCTWTEYEITEYEDRESGGIDYKVFAFKNIAAKHMGDEIRAVLYADKNGVTYNSDVDVYSVETYSYNRLQNSTDDDFKNLLADMLNYGAAAQVYFNYNTGHPVNAGLADYPQYGTAETPELVSVENNIETAGATAHYYGKTVVLGNSVEVKYYMTFDSGAPADSVKLVVSYTSIDDTEHTVTIPASKFEYSTKYQAYGGKVTSIAAKDMGCVLTAAVYDGDTLISDVSEYSIETYAYNRLLKSTDENFKTLVREMMKYGKSAENYFRNKN